MVRVTTTTTVGIYRDDLAWLKRKQLEMSATKGEIMPIHDVIKELIKAVEAGQEGA